MALSLAVVAFRFFSRAGGCFPAAGRLQCYAGSAGFRKSNRDRLLARGCSMLSFPYVVHLLTHKFSSLGAGRLAFASIFMSAFQGFFFRHDGPPWLKPKLLVWGPASKIFCKSMCHSL